MTSVDTLRKENMYYLLRERGKRASNRFVLRKDCKIDFEPVINEDFIILRMLISDDDAWTSCKVTVTCDRKRKTSLAKE